MLRAFLYNCIRLFVKNQRVKLPLDNSSIKRLLILRHDRLGDMVVTLPMLDILREYLPDATIDVFASHRNYEFIKDDPRVNSVYVWDGSLLNLMKLRRTLRDNNYDVAICTVFFKLTKIGILMNYLLGSNVIKITQGRATPEKQQQYYTWYNALSEVYTHDKKMVSSLIEVAVDVLGVNPDTNDDTVSRRFKIHVNTTHLEQRKLLGIPDTAFVMFYNLSAGTEDRELTSTQHHYIISSLVQSYPSAYIILNAVGVQSDVALSLKKLSDKIVYSSKHHSIQELIDNINCSDLVFTPDTSITHFSYALTKPIFVLCTTISTSKHWHPFGVKYVTLYSNDKTPISTLSEQILADSLVKFISEVKPENL
jgi:ADP-heptose:LPS heptosyltransferase